MTTTLMIFHGIISVLLIVVVLLQFGKGAEVGFIGGGASDAVFTGAQKGNIFTKITIVLSIIFMGNSIFLAKLQSINATRSLLDEETPMVRPLNTDPVPTPVDSSGLDKTQDSRAKSGEIESPARVE